MIKLNDIDIYFSNMGLFDTEADWTHPTVTVDSYELIYVTEGAVSIREGNDRFDLNRGEMLTLAPLVEHGGTEVSHGHTAFWWLHFYSDAFNKLDFPKRYTPPAPDTEKAFKEIMHLSLKNPLLAELELCRLLLSSGGERDSHSKLAYELDDYIRINARFNPSVALLSRRFGYNPDYLSRIYKSEFGCDLKTGIVKHRLTLIESLLVNTDCSIKEIAAECSFDGENALIKFLKYHKGTTPTLLRNKFYRIHMNNR